MVFHRNVLFSQSLDKSKRIPEGYRSILKSMPYKSLGHLVSHLFFQRHFLFKGFIRISQKIPDAFCMGNLLVRADHRITEDQSLGPEIFRSTACCFPHVGLLPENSVAGRQMASCGKSHNQDPVRVNMPLLCLIPEIFHRQSHFMKSGRIYRRGTGIPEHCRMIAHSIELERHRLCLSVGRHSIGPSRADQY